MGSPLCSFFRVLLFWIRAVTRRSPFRSDRANRRLAQVLLPAAPERLDQLDGGDEALARKLGVGALGLEGVPAGVHHLEVTDDAGAITVRGQVRGAARVGDGALLGCGLVGEMPDGGQAVLHLAEGDEDLLAIARHRQQVLVAFGEVENSLAAIRHLADQAAAQQRAVANAGRAADLATDRYRAGIVSYLEVVDASRDALQAERADAQLAGQRLVPTVQLIKALGGGWKEDVRQASIGPVRSKR